MSQALREILAILDGLPNGKWISQVRGIVERAMRHKPVLGSRSSVGARLSDDEDARRRAIYELRLTDAEAGGLAGRMSRQGFHAWRKSRGLKAWRGKGRRPRSDNSPP